MTVSERLRSASYNKPSRRGNELPRLGEYGSFVGGQWIKTGDVSEVRSPYNNALVAVVHRASAKEIGLAISGAVEAFQVTRKLPVWKRAEVLEKISAGIAARREEFAQTIALEAGKPLKTARTEVDRAVFTFKVASEESEADLWRDCSAGLAIRDGWSSGSHPAGSAGTNCRHHTIQFPD